MRILIVTYGCDPRGISEPIVAYNWVRRLAERHDVTLLNCRRQVESPVASELPGVRVVEWVEPAGLERFERFNTMARPTYPLFMRRVRGWIHQALAAGERFDLGYQPVPVSLRYPSPLRGYDFPYVIGPVGGSLADPPGFGGEETSPTFTRLRQIDGWRLRRDPILRRSFAGAACVLGIADYVGEFLAQAKIEVRRFETMPDTALDELPAMVDRTGRTGPVRMLFVGRIVRTKGVRDGVAAFAQARENAQARGEDFNAVFDIVGDGFDRQHCEQLATDLGVAADVHFHGLIPKEDVEDYYRDADVFVFPSYREAGGTVSFEALGHGLPMITADRGGPANVVDDTCGIRVSPTSPAEYVTAIAEAMQLLVADEQLRARMSQGARLRTEQIATWPSRLDRLDEIFADALADQRQPNLAGQIKPPSREVVDPVGS